MFVYNLFARLLKKPELKQTISIQTSALISIHDVVTRHLRPLVLLLLRPFLCSPVCRVILRCDPGFLGQTCDCQQSEDHVSLYEKCRHGGSSQLCSGHGSCECGKCACQRSFSGQFCECDDSNCAKSNQQLCGGREALTMSQTTRTLMHNSERTGSMHKYAVSIAVNTCTPHCVPQETGSVFVGSVTARALTEGRPATAPRTPTGARRQADPVAAAGNVSATDASARAGLTGTTAPTFPTTAPNTSECG